MNKDNQEVKMFQEAFEKPVAYSVSEFKNLREAMKEEDKFDKMSFSEKVEFYMRENRMDIDELSSHIGIDEETLDFLKNGCDPSELDLCFIQNIAAALELSKEEVGDLVMACFK